MLRRWSFTCSEKTIKLIGGASVEINNDGASCYCKLHQIRCFGCWFHLFWSRRLFGCRRTHGCSGRLLVVHQCLHLQPRLLLWCDGFFFLTTRDASIALVWRPSRLWQGERHLFCARDHHREASHRPSFRWRFCSWILNQALLVIDVVCGWDWFSFSEDNYYSSSMAMSCFL